MTPQQVLSRCLSKPGAYEDYPFGPQVTVVKVGKTPEKSGRIFAQLFSLQGQPTLTLNCDRLTGEFYRSQFPQIVVRGYHCPPVQQPYFNTLPLNGALPEEVLLEMIDHSYAQVVGKLPKKVRDSLGD